MRGNGNTGKRRVTFAYDTEPGHSVSVTGSFSDWNGERALRECGSNGHYEVRMFVPKGRHEYKFIVDGEWHVDPRCPDWVPNEHGTLNSVVVVE